MRDKLRQEKKLRVATIREARHIRAVFGPVAERLEAVEAFLQKELDQAQPLVREVAGYVVGSGGKRLRPALVLLINRMLGGRGERDVRYGAVVELIHTATLIHDDIIDQSDLRRGRPTANHRFGNQTTVLVGDWLYTRSMSLCLEFGDVEVMRLLTGATLQMTEGEIMADRVRGHLDVPESLYMDITRRKTAELFAAACAVPALFQPATLHFTEPLLEYGRDLGLCFQLIDDLLDFTAKPTRLGKPVMSDLREGRVTLPVIRLLKRLDVPQRSRLESVVRTGSFQDISESEVLEMVRTSGVLEEVRGIAARHAERAVEHTRSLPPSPERDSLVRATSLLLEREI
jgi:octaprenyl-diphosphate synthase